jgi:hypothetical protein
LAACDACADPSRPFGCCQKSPHPLAAHGANESIGFRLVTGISRRSQLAPQGAAPLALVSPALDETLSRLVASGFASVALLLARRQLPAVVAAALWLDEHLVVAAQ